MAGRKAKQPTRWTPSLKTRVVNMLQRGEMTKIEAITRYDVRRGTLVRWLKRRRAKMADVDIICLRIAAELKGQKSCL